MSDMDTLAAYMQATLEALGLAVTVAPEGAGWLATAQGEGLTARQGGETREAALLALLVYFREHPLDSAPPLGVV